MVGLKRLTPIDALNLVGAGIVVYLSVLLGQTIYHNYQLNRQIETLQSEISLLQAQQAQLKYNIAYYKTDSFKDREARAKLGLQLPGENILILPSPHTSEPKASTEPTAPVQKKSDFGQWLDFLTGKS